MTVRHSVAYLVSQYPAPSHAFIEREIAGLRRTGFDVTTFSVRPTFPEELLDEAMQAEASRTTSIQGDNRGALRDLLCAGRHRPLRFARTLLRALSSGEPRLRARVWQVFYLAEAVRLFTWMRAAGLRHLHVHFANNGADIGRLVVAFGRAVDGPNAGWRWSFTMHGPTEFGEVARYDLAQKVRDADGVACITDFARSQLMRLVEPEHWDKLSVVRMSVDTDRYAPLPAKAPVSSACHILSVGRLVPEKGWHVLVEALSLVAADGIDLRVSVVGAGPLHDELVQRVEALGMSESVTFLGAVGQDRLPAIYRSADLFCLPSFQEGLPVVLMEAMASGLAVITTPIAGVPELVQDGVTGRLVPPGRADALAAAIRDLVAHPTARDALASAALSRVRELHASSTTTKDQSDFLASVQPRGSFY